MMLAPILVPMFVVIAAEADAVVKKWVAAQEDVHAVHATFQHFEYNHVFGTVTESRGEIYCTSPTNGFYSLFPPSEKNASERITVGNETYRSVPRDPNRIIWEGPAIIFIDEERKKYYRRPREFWLFGKHIIPSITQLFPFLPGLPNQKATSGWTFRIVSETDAEVRLHGSPPKALPNQNQQYRSCDLILQKPAWNLSAERYSHVDDSTQTVFVFQSVERNPGKLPDVDLSGYTAYEAVSTE